MQSAMRVPAGFPHLSLPRILIVAAREPAGEAPYAYEKSTRLIDHARRVVQRSGAIADVLDLGWLGHSKNPAFALSPQVLSLMSTCICSEISWAFEAAL